MHRLVHYALMKPPMAETRGHSTHWTKWGQPKTRFKSPQAAARHLTERGWLGMVIYKCQECGGVHIGKANRGTPPEATFDPNRFKTDA